MSTRRLVMTRALRLTVREATLLLEHAAIPLPAWYSPAELASISAARKKIEAALRAAQTRPTGRFGRRARCAAPGAEARTEMKL